VGKSAGVLEHKSSNIFETRKYRGNVTIGAYSVAGLLDG